MLLSTVAQFKTSKCFSIVGIGQVLTGNIIEGVIDAGYYIQLDGISYKIDSVEAVDYVSRGESETGLIFDVAPNEFQTSVANVLGQIISITTLP
ncbi:hypothetical protein [Mucilaginibacter lacusdianchii]|uniref:hypothetical protein n=1 Tax=Mucilaginibacter lacusdianchii TaxID=2684211 RepID=UPI00131B9C44|nr:hypothetical protein [Mucilaginibacter sp. JXJ CY 39]